MSRAGVKNWGDDDEDELPEVHDTAVDAKGFKTRTEYIINDRSQKVKVTSKIRVIEEKMRTPIAVKERRARLQKFGNAIGVVDESNVTIIDYNEIYMLTPKDSEAEDSGSNQNVNKAFETFQRKQQHRALARKYDLNAPEEEAPEEGGGGMFGNAGKGLAGMAAGGAGKYVPPSARGGAAGGMGGSLSAMEVRECHAGELARALTEISPPLALPCRCTCGSPWTTAI